MPQGVLSGPNFVAGLKSEMRTTYRRRIEDVNARLGLAMRIAIPSTRRTESYWYWESAPHARRWVRGQTLPSKGFKGVKFSTTNFEWAQSVEWHWTDRDDDQTQSLMERARDAGKNFAILDERVFFQILNGTTDAELLPSIPLAPDGAALFATTAGGSNRFGATLGNLIVPAVGIGSSQDVRTNLFAVLAQARLFQDTEGQPLFDDSDMSGTILIIYGSANEQIFREAHIQARTVDSAVAVTNIVLDSGMKIALMSTPRITTNDAYYFFTAVELRPIFSQVRQELREYFNTWQNSDATTNTGMERLQWVGRRGYGIALPYATIQQNL